MSYPTGKQLLDGAIRFALSTIPAEELQKLFASLGYDTDDITLALCVEAWDKFGEEFTKPFFSLAQDQLEDADKMKAVRKSLLNGELTLSRADGKNSTNSETGSKGFDQQKWENTQSVLGYLFGMCESGYKTYTQAQSDANAAAIRAESEARAMELQVTAQQNMTKWLIVGGGILLVIVVVIALVISKRKP